MNGRKLIYREDHIEIFINKAPQGWVPLWEKELDAYKLEDIGKDLLGGFDDETIDSIYWFFEDLETMPSGEAIFDDSSYTQEFDTYSDADPGL